MIISNRIRKLKLVTVDIFYYMPDYKNIVQEFICQTEDIVSELKRTHQFLLYWKDNIDAIIKEVLVSHSDGQCKNSYKSVDHFLKLQ